MGVGGKEGRAGTVENGPEYSTMPSGLRGRRRMEMVVGRQGGKERTHANPDPKNVRERILHLGPQDPPGHTHLVGVVVSFFFY